MAAGAISKANSNDPKKSSLVRCARTDKGVHAAGNVISLKLIVEEADIVQKINEQLPAQIRVWGIERTIGSFSSYQQCDSRIYEYLLPSHVLLPPHPRSYLGQMLQNLAIEAKDVEGLNTRQSDVLDFWSVAEATYVNPAVGKLDPLMRESATAAAHQSLSAPEIAPSAEDQVKDAQQPSKSGGNGGLEQSGPLAAAVRRLKSAYIGAKKKYRTSRPRLERLREALKSYQGTHNFHNYTIDKNFRDASAKRHIISFKVDEPLVIGNTEWLSLKVHGQSFMMHQIRKMVSMAALVVRTGCTLERIKETYGPEHVTIPRAPGLGLLLERPVFDHYNERAVDDFQRNKIDFDNYEAEIEEFKRTMIYEHIFQEEERGNQ